MAPENNTFLPEYSRFLDSRSHLTYAALSTFRNFQDTLSEKEKRFLKNHLDTCLVCSRKYREVGEVEGESEETATLKARWLSTPVFRYSIAAAFLLAVGASIVYYRARNPEKPSVQSIAAIIPDPERFVVNPLLESSVGRTVRSGSAYTFVIPRAGDTLTAPFTFTWEGGKAGRNCSLTIVDNKNVEVWKRTTQTDRLTYEQPLTPGLYYAKLEAGGVLVQVGKFVSLDERRQ
jgi:hypothetical protein